MGVNIKRNLFKSMFHIDRRYKFDFMVQRCKFLHTHPPNIKCHKCVLDKLKNPTSENYFCHKISKKTSNKQFYKKKKKKKKKREREKIFFFK